MLEKKVKHALEILEKFKDWQYKWAFFSGGKDSLVCLDLCYRVWKDDFTIIYCEVTGNTHSKCTKYAYKIANEYPAEFVHVKQEKYDFFDCLEKRGYPSLLWTSQRWCLTNFKCEPIAAFTKGRGVGVAGLSPYNSARRAFILRCKSPVWVDPKPTSRHWSYYSLQPLFFFTKCDIWQYIALNELPVNPLYKEIGFSGNCMICPGMNKREFLTVMQKCPEFFCRWKKVHEKLRQDYVEGKLRGMRSVFHHFNKWYELYCRNKTLEEVL